jgi:hypothetical protein
MKTALKELALLVVAVNLVFVAAKILLPMISAADTIQVLIGVNGGVVCVVAVVLLVVRWVKMIGRALDTKIQGDKQ